MKIAHLLFLLSLVTSTCNARPKSSSSSPSSKESPSSPPTLVFCNINKDELGIIDIDSDILSFVSFKDIIDWPYMRASGNTQHAAISPDAKTVFVTTISNGGTSSAAVVTIQDMGGGEIGMDNLSNLKVVAVSEFGDPTTSSDFPDDILGTDVQPIPSWTLPAYAQIHGPSRRVNTPFWYFGTWTNKVMLSIDTNNNFELTATDYPGLSDHSHGFFFSPDGKKAIGNPYTFGTPFETLYEFDDDDNDSSGDISSNDNVVAFPDTAARIHLGPDSDNEYGSFTHYSSWLDNRFAYTATMQLGGTSVAPEGFSIGGPSIYLIDAKFGTATKVAGSTNELHGAGVLNSASDTIIANGKVYVSEERTLDGSFPDTASVGSVSVWKIEANRSLTFLKRLSQGVDGVPYDFAVGHGSIVTIDQRYVFVFSYASNHAIKIDTDTDVVVNVWDSSDGMAACHGAFVAGGDR